MSDAVNTIEKREIGLPQKIIPETLKCPSGELCQKLNSTVLMG